MVSALAVTVYETVTMTCKVNHLKKANNQPARICWAMLGLYQLPTERKVKRQQSINNQLMGTVAAVAWQQ